MLRRSFFSGAVRRNGEKVIDQSWNSGNQSHYHSGYRKPGCHAGPIGIMARQRDKIRHDSAGKKSDRKWDEHRMKWMPFEMSRAAHVYCMRQWMGQPALMLSEFRNVLPKRFAAYS